MITQWQKVKLSLFVMFALFILVFTLLYLSTNKLFEKRDIYYVDFYDASVHGLEVGTQVKLKGVRVGRIEEIGISKKDYNAVHIKLSLEANTPIPKDTEATMQFLGITGLKYIELSYSGKVRELLKPGDTIKAGQSLVQSITGRASDIAEKFEFLLVRLNNSLSEENLKNFSSILNNVNGISNNLNQFTNENKAEFNEILVNVNKIIKETEIVMNQISKTNIQHPISMADSVLTDLNEANIKQTINNLNVLIDQTSKMVNHIDLTVKTSREDLVRTIRTLKETIENLNTFARLISEDPSLLLRGKKEVEGQQ